MEDQQLGATLDAVLPSLQENLSKFVGKDRALHELQEALRILDLDPSSERGTAAASRLADFFVSKGGIFAFVGRAAKIRIATRALDEITEDHRLKP